jgi:hypothetical protein
MTFLFRLSLLWFSGLFFIPRKLGRRKHRLILMHYHKRFLILSIEIRADPLRLPLGSHVFAGTTLVGDFVLNPPRQLRKLSLEEPVLNSEGCTIQYVDIEEVAIAHLLGLLEEVHVVV